MRHLLALFLLASCAETSSRGPEMDPPMPEDPAPPEPQPPPADDPMAVLSKFQSCMTLADFQAANMAGTWGTMTTSTNTKCSSCHNPASYGFAASSDAQVFFDFLANDRDYLLEYVTVAPDAQGGYQVVANDQLIPSVGAGQAPHAEHPRFMPATGMTAVHAFVDATLSHCAAPI